MKLKLYNDFLKDDKCLALAKNKGWAYLGTFTLFGETLPYQVFRIIESNEYTFYALKRGPKIKYVEPEALKDWRYRYAAKCLTCKKIVYSSYKHHMQWCKCLSLNVDGGHDILRTNDSPHEVVLIDMIEGRIK